MIRSAIIKTLLGGSFPFSSVWKLLYCARFCKLLYFARDPSVQSHFLNCGLRPLFADVSVRLRCWGKNRPPPNVPTCPLTPRHNSQLTTSTWALSHANMLVASLMNTNFFMCRGFLPAEISGLFFIPLNITQHIVFSKCGGIHYTLYNQNDPLSIVRITGRVLAFFIAE